jgi:hypothetical protein
MQRFFLRRAESFGGERFKRMTASRLIGRGGRRPGAGRKPAIMKTRDAAAAGDVLAIRRWFEAIDLLWRSARAGKAAAQIALWRVREEAAQRAAGND